MRPGWPYWHPVEHLLLVFEILAHLKIRPLLWAIVPKSHAHEFPQHYLNRLASSGINMMRTNVTVDELWTTTSATRLALLRPGKHLCVSWRMVDYLAMSACFVCDRAL